MVLIQELKEFNLQVLLSFRIIFFKTILLNMTNNGKKRGNEHKKKEIKCLYSIKILI